MTPPMTDLNELLGRVEAATGPDRQLGALILEELTGVSVERVGDPWGVWTVNETPILHCPFVDPAASLDAALALVERVRPGALWRVGSFEGRCSARIAEYDPQGRATVLVNVIGKTAPLALLAALLRSLLAGQTPEPSLDLNEGES